MPSPRKLVVDENSSGYFHCYNRCVRRAFLCGDDPYTGQNFDHRRAWIEDRILHLGELFSADIFAYAVMSNHYHVVLYIDKERAAHWSTEEVAERWLTLCPPALARYENYDNPTEAKSFPNFVSILSGDEERIEEYRRRLGDLSWYMRFLNEYIAREANREDRVKGRFWERRFKAQALLDEGAVLACMTYVDLNPVRAGIVKTPEQSDFTSVQARINSGVNDEKQLLPIACSDAEELSEAVKGIATIKLKDYLSLVDWTGRQLRDDKTGAIPRNLASILIRLQLDPENWLVTSRYFGHRFGSIAGHLDQIMSRANAMGKQWFQGMKMAESSYLNAEV